MKVSAKENVLVATAIEPSRQDLDDVIRDLERSWRATITVRRQSPADVGYREIFLSLDGESIGMLRYGDVIAHDTTPGPHRLLAHNTLFRKTLDFTLAAGERAEFSTVNGRHWLTYSGFALFVGFLGAGPFTLALEREASVRSSASPPRF